MLNTRWALGLFFGLILFIGFSHANSQSIEDLGYKALKNGEYKKALRYISFLATNGDAKAQYNMGIFYRDGVEVKRNKLEALRWFLKAASGGNMLAEYAAGLAFYRGHGSAPDPQTALEYFLKATLKGHATAPLHIGRQYYAGIGVTQNYARAYFWWKLAKDRNVGGADINLRHLSKIMNKEETAEALKLTAKCRTITLRQCLKFLVPQINQ